MIDQTYEKAERDLLFSFVRDGDTFFDIGANTGLYAVTFAQRFPKSRVCAFEPVPQVYEELKANTAGIKNVSIYDFGFSDQPGLVDFHFSSVDIGATSLAPLEEDRFGPVKVITRSVTNLDNWCAATRPLRLDIIKCDVEGAELLVFQGAKETLSTFHPIIQCEMLRKWAKRFNYHPNDLIAYLGRFGYRCFVLRGGKLEQFDEMTDETKETNFFFISASRVERAGL
jgi:FkbM family methyltransferase